MCKFVVSYVENIIQTNKSAAAIEAALEKVCSIIPGALKDKCDKFVTTYGPLIAILLAKYNDTTQVCNALKACNNGTEFAFPGMFIHCRIFSVNCKVSSLRSELNAANIKSAECSLCKYIVSYVDSVIQNNKSEAAIEAALEKVCTILPTPLKAPCKTFVDTYGPILVKLLEKYTTPEQVCDALKICNNGTQVVLPSEFSFLQLLQRFRASSFALRRNRSTISEIGRMFVVQIHRQLCRQCYSKQQIRSCHRSCLGKSLYDPSCTIESSMQNLC